MSTYYATMIIIGKGYT